MLPVFALSLAIASIGTASPGSPAEAPSSVAECRAAVLGNPDLGHGRMAFGEYPGWAEGLKPNRDGTWTVKMGAAVRGSRPVTVSVIPAHRHRAALIYGGHTSASQVRFEPCADHARSTGWAGGVKVTERRPFRVEIRSPGRPPIRRALLDEPRHLSRAADRPTGEASCREGYETPRTSRQRPALFDPVGRFPGDVWRDDGVWHMGLGAIVPRRRPVTVSVVHRQRPWAAIALGNSGASKVRFVPCRSGRSTWWTGNVVLRKVHPVVVEVNPVGAPPSREVLFP